VASAREVADGADGTASVMPSLGHAADHDKLRWPLRSASLAPIEGAVTLRMTVVSRRVWRDRSLEVVGWFEDTQVIAHTSARGVDWFTFGGRRGHCFASTCSVTAGMTCSP
jgi:hypothetical protein